MDVWLQQLAAQEDATESLRVLVDRLLDGDAPLRATGVALREALDDERLRPMGLQQVAARLPKAPPGWSLPGGWAPVFRDRWLGDRLDSATLDLALWPVGITETDHRVLVNRLVFWPGDAPHRQDVELHLVSTTTIENTIAAAIDQLYRVFAHYWPPDWAAEEPLDIDMPPRAWLETNLAGPLRQISAEAMQLFVRDGVFFAGDRPWYALFPRLMECYCDGAVSLEEAPRAFGHRCRPNGLPPTERAAVELVLQLALLRLLVAYQDPDSHRPDRLDVVLYAVQLDAAISWWPRIRTAGGANALAGLLTLHWNWREFARLRERCADWLGVAWGRGYNFVGWVNPRELWPPD